MYWKKGLKVSVLAGKEKIAIKKEGKNHTVTAISDFPDACWN